MSSDDTLESIKKMMVTGDIASIEKILDKLLVKDKNMLLKTDLENVRAFVTLCVIQKDLEDRGLKRSAKTLKWYIDFYVDGRVSNNRLSRKEILDAISAVKREQSNSMTAKLIGMDDKKDK